MQRRISTQVCQALGEGGQFGYGGEKGKEEELKGELGPFFKRTRQGRLANGLGKERQRMACEEGVWIGKSMHQEPIVWADTSTQQQTNPVVPAILFPNPPFRPHQA